MGRIPAAEIEQLKLQVDLVALVRARGVELKKHGKDLVGRCPFHDDKTPSLVVTPGKNLWHCMGACQTGGSVIDWIMRMDRVTFRHAVEILRMGDSSLLVAEKETLHARKLPSPLNPYASDPEIMKQSVEFYNDTLKNRAPEALTYLEERGIRHAEAIDKFKLGFSNRTLGLRLPLSRDADGAELRERLMKTGLLRDTGHEHFSGTITFPIWDEEGNVSEIYGRRIVRPTKPGTPVHFYLPGPHRGVWNPEAMASPDVILCEALIDALSFWVSGLRNVTAAFGVEGFTKDHLAGFLKGGVKKVYIAYDRDPAGDKAAEKLSKKLLAEGIETMRVRFPRGMDANDFILKVKPPAQSLKLCVQSAEWMGRLPNRKAATAAAKPEPAKAQSAPEVAAPTPPAAVVPVPVEPLSLVAAPAPAPAPQAPVLAEIFRKVDPPPAPVAAAAVVMRGEDEPPLSEATTAEFAAERAAAGLSVPTEVKGEDVLIRLGAREYRVRGLKKNLAFEILRVNVRVGSGAKYFVDTLDLYQAKARTQYIHAAAEEIGVTEETIKRDLGRVLLKCEELQEAEIKKALDTNPAKKEVQSTSAEKDEALALLQSPNLLQTIVADFARAGMIGEEVNKLVGYLAAVSRKLDDPLAVIIQSSSAAGKSSLMEAVLAMVPEEDKVKYSAMTGQSLFYMGETDLKHKILAIAEEQGAQQAAYALKLLQSEGEISIASTGKDATTGKLVTHKYRVEGPVMIFLTTTAIEVDEEFLNRCVVLTVNETREQTRLIHELQRKAQTLEGLVLKQERAHVLAVHQNAQRLLRSLWVVNPFAEQLTFVDSRTRTRRDHIKYLALIRVIALLHQHQRKTQWMSHRGKNIEYVEVIPRDIEIANELCHQVLGRSLDELPPQTSKMLTMLGEMVEAATTREQIHRKDYRFTRRQVREHTGWSDFQVQTHMTKLMRLEYVLAHRGGRGQSFVYELLFDQGAAKHGQPVLSGLIDPAKLTAAAAKPCNYDSKFEGLTQSFEHQKGQFEGSNSIHIAPIEGGCRSPEASAHQGDSVKNAESGEKNHIRGVSRASIVDAAAAVVPRKKGAAS